jgi:hypothetical protein
VYICGSCGGKGSGVGGSSAWALGKAGGLGEDANDQPAESEKVGGKAVMLSQFARESMIVRGIRGVSEFYNVDFCREVLFKGGDESGTYQRRIVIQYPDGERGRLPGFTRPSFNNENIGA